MCPPRITAALFVAACAGWPAPSWADFSTTAGYSYSGVARAHPDLNQFFMGDHTTVKVGDQSYQPNTDQQSFLKTATGVHGVAEAAGSVLATAHFGVLKAKVDVTISATNSTPSPFGTDTARVEVTYATATAGWRDSFVPRVSTLLPGTPLLLTAIFKVEGDLLAFANAGGCCARAEANVTLKDHAGNQFIDLGAVNTFPVQPTDGSDNPNFELEVPILSANGIRRDVGYTLTVRGEGYANRGHFLATSIGSSTSVFTSDYIDTLRWGGIKDVTVVATGERVLNWTIESESGFDYSRPAPVPAPASVFTLPIGLAILLRRSRQRRGKV